MKLEILFEYDTELAEFEALNKGYRGDVTVKIGDKSYKVYVTSMIRLQQDFETEIRDSGYYLSVPNMIIVKETTKQEIQDTIIQMFECKYFEKIDNNGF
jgi:hypothetical protein